MDLFGTIDGEGVGLSGGYRAHVGVREAKDAQGLVDEIEKVGLAALGVETMHGVADPGASELLQVIVLIGDWKSAVYLLCSQMFMTGFLHPTMFGMILSNSHFHGHSNYQPSASYYGWFNRLTFNFGLHTEHHDIAGIPWSRLPRLRQIAPPHSGHRSLA